MSIILNNFTGSSGFSEALKQLAQGADALSIGVSYIQMGGWDLLRKLAPDISPDRMKVVCTDQMNITQPAAVSRAIAEGVNMRNFCGPVTYHPKMILAHDTKGHPIRFLIGSANLSYSAFTNSVEAGLLGTDKKDLKILKRWFDDVFLNQSEIFTQDSLRAMEENWRRAAATRTQTRLRVRRGIVIPPGTPIPVEAEDIDTLEDIFATIQLPIGLLNFDYARNNIRNVGYLREVLSNWRNVKTDKASSKQRSELKLLGFVAEGQLSALGRAAAAAQSEEEVALLWCRWLQQTAEAQLESINPKLLDAKRVFSQFWRLQPDVRDYFLANAVNPEERRTLQTIELLCNSREVVQELSLEDIRTLEPLLDQPERLPPNIRTEIAEYFDNKGTRSWKFADRRIFPNAWHRAEQS
ncbi:MAG: phospholipase D-like domain-containing protein [Kiritimatiellales bacterium]